MPLPRTVVVDLAEASGGVTTREIGLLRAFGGESVSLAALEGSPAASSASQAGCRVHILGRRKLDPANVGRLRSVIRAEDVRVLDAQNPQARIVAARAARSSRAQVVATFNSWPRDEYGTGSLKGWLFSLSDRYVLRRCALAVAVSEAIAERIRGAGFPRNRVEVVDNAVAVPELDSATCRAEWRSRLGLGDETRLLACVGRLVHAKGYDWLLDLLPRLEQRVGPLSVAVAGDGPQRDELVRRGEELPRGAVRFLGNLPHADVLELVRASDVFLMPSRSEGMPQALLEAAALERPIVATSVGGVGQVLASPREARLIEFGDDAGWIDAVTAVLREPEMAAVMARAARHRVLTDFSTSRQAQRLAELYARAASAAPERSRESAWQRAL